MFQFRNVVGIGTGEIEFHGGITAIVGGNGVGKTTLLQSILGALDVAKAPDSASIKRRLSGSRLRIRLRQDKELVNAASTFDRNFRRRRDGVVDVVVDWLDAAEVGARMISFFSHEENLNELLEAHTPIQFDKKRLEEISYISGKDYSDVRVYELDEFDPIRPYFLVTAGEVQYGSETMGLGEMALFCLYWFLQRCAPRSILLIEEPETFLSHKSQITVLNLLAKYSTTNKVWVVLTTHSPGIVTRIPLRHIRLMFREGASVRIVQHPTRKQLRDILGIEDGYAGVIVVEDKLARELTRAWLGQYDIELLQQLDIKDVGSNGEVVESLKHTPQVSWLRVVGLLDGDERDKEHDETHWPLTFLPGNQPPEILLRTASIANPSLLASELSRDEGELRFIISQLEGADPHDWLEDLVNQLHLPYSQVVSALFAVWVSLPENDASAENALQELQARLAAIEEPNTAPVAPGRGKAQTKKATNREANPRITVEVSQAVEAVLIDPPARKPTSLPKKRKSPG
jgi:predicted ATPase